MLVNNIKFLTCITRKSCHYCQKYETKLKNSIFVVRVKFLRLNYSTFLAKKVYFHGLPDICPVLNNTEAFVGGLIYQL